MVTPAQIQRALDERKSLAAIAAELGLSVGVVQYRIAAFGLIKPLPKKALNRRQPRPASIIDRSKKARRPVVRECITCREIFRSEGPHNRMCTACRHAPEDLVYIVQGTKK